MTKKLWKKTNVITDVGKCKYCLSNIVNTDSFVSFYKTGHAHYECMKKDDDLRQRALNTITQQIDQQLKQEKEQYG
jgi:hypothetical protein